MLCPWWLRRAGQCCLQLLILKPLPLAYFFFPSPNSYMCKRCHQPGTITWISALIAWLTFAATITWKESQLLPEKKKDLSPFELLQ